MHYFTEGVPISQDLFNRRAVQSEDAVDAGPAYDPVKFSTMTWPMVRLEMLHDLHFHSREDDK